MARLRVGDESAFADLVDRHHLAMVRLATGLTGSHAVGQEAAQEAWLGVLEGIDRFECRSTLRTWIFRILVNVARRRWAQEHRSVPFSALLVAGEEDGPGAEAGSFLPADHPRWHGHWAAPAASWAGGEERLLAKETRAVLAAAIAALPPGQRAVISLRDVEGLHAAEVCDVLGLTDANQRVLLHRARTRVRAALDRYLSGS